MESEQPRSKTLEELLDEKAQVSRRIIELDAKKDKGEEWNTLHNRYEELTQLIEEMPNRDEVDSSKAA